MFRDDYEAVRARAEALQKELDTERGRSEATESERKRLLAELEAARRELERLRPPGQQKRARVAGIIVAIVSLLLVLVVAAAAVGMYLVFDTDATEQVPYPSGE